MIGTGSGGSLGLPRGVDFLLARRLFCLTALIHACGMGTSDGARPC